MQSPTQRRLARRILAQAGLHHVAHDHFVYRIRLNSGAVGDFGNHSSAKFRSRKR